MLNAVKHLYHRNNQFRLRVLEVLHLFHQNEKRMQQHFRCLMLLGILVICFHTLALGSNQSLVKVQLMNERRWVAASDSQRIEAQALRQGTAQRHAGEPDSVFLARVLPVSYPCSKDLVSYSWRPSTFGKQLFFSVRGSGDNEGGRNLFVLDPIGAGVYTVQVLILPSMGNLTDLAALFFVDVDQNGQKELLTLLTDSFNEQWKADNGELNFAYRNHYQTLVFQYVGMSNAGRPRYREDQTPRTYLDELPTAAAVRQAIMRHQQRAAKHTLLKKPSK